MTLGLMFQNPVTSDRNGLERNQNSMHIRARKPLHLLNTTTKKYPTSLERGRFT